MKPSRLHDLWAAPREVIRRFASLSARRQATIVAAFIAGTAMLLMAIAPAASTNQIEISDVSASTDGDLGHTFTENDLRPQVCIDQNIAVADVAAAGDPVEGADGVDDGNGNMIGNLVLAHPGASAVKGGDAPDCIVSTGTAAINGDKALDMSNPGDRNVPNANGDVCIGPMTVDMYNCQYLYLPDGTPR